eukprot:TRINITY_DN3150_c0_g5_i1.p1 TRINITY_DN3150_c0_g5~~TRINITY_DN3150_c0_g5_i1.p1  ORF type:complete len:3425 (+),score=883.54 TRINITY_DN3150_c0_g5_i1:60-10277(+)
MAAPGPCQPHPEQVPDVAPAPAASPAKPPKRHRRRPKKPGGEPPAPQPGAGGGEAAPAGTVSDTQRRVSAALEQLEQELERTKGDRDRVTQLLFDAVHLAKEGSSLSRGTTPADPKAAAQLLQVLGMEETLRRQREACRSAHSLLAEALTHTKQLQQRADELERERDEARRERDAACRRLGELQEELARRSTGAGAAPSAAPTPPTTSVSADGIGPLEQGAVKAPPVASPAELREARETTHAIQESFVRNPLVRPPSGPPAFAGGPVYRKAESFLVERVESESVAGCTITPAPSATTPLSHEQSSVQCKTKPRLTITPVVQLEQPPEPHRPVFEKVPSQSLLARRPSGGILRREGAPALQIEESPGAARRVSVVSPGRAPLPASPRSRRTSGESTQSGGGLSPASDVVPTAESQEDHVFNYRRKLPWEGEVQGAGSVWEWASRCVPVDFSMYALVRGAKAATLQRGRSTLAGPHSSSVSAAAPLRRHSEAGRRMVAGTVRSVNDDALDMLQERPFFERQRTVKLMLLGSVIVEVIDSALDINTCIKYSADRPVLSAVIALVLVVAGLLRGCLHLYMERKNTQTMGASGAAEKIPLRTKLYIASAFLPIPFVDFVEGILAYNLVRKLDPTSFLVMEPVRTGRQQLRAVFRAICEAAPQLVVQVIGYSRATEAELDEDLNRRLLQASMIVSGLSILKAVLMYVRQATGAQSRGALLDEFNLTDPEQKKALFDPSPLQLLQRMQAQEFTTFVSFMCSADFGYVRLDDVMLLLSSAPDILCRMKGSAEGRVCWPHNKALLILNCFVPFGKVLEAAYEEAVEGRSADPDKQLCTTALAVALSEALLAYPRSLADQRFDMGLTFTRQIKRWIPTFCGGHEVGQEKPGMVFAGGVAGGQAIGGEGAVVLAAVIAGQCELRWLDASGNKLAEPFTPHDCFASVRKRKRPEDWIWQPADAHDEPLSPTRIRRTETNASALSDPGGTRRGSDLIFAAILESSAKGEQHRLSHVDLRANGLENDQLWTAARLSLAMCFGVLPTEELVPCEGTRDSRAFHALRMMFSQSDTWRENPDRRLRPIHIIVRGGNGTAEVSGVDLDRIDVVVQAVIDMFHDEFRTGLVPQSGGATAHSAACRYVHGPCTLDKDDLEAMSALLRDFACLRALCGSDHNVVQELRFLNKVFVKPEEWPELSRSKYSLRIFGNFLTCQYAGLKVRFQAPRCVMFYVSRLLSLAAHHAEPRNDVRMRTLYSIRSCSWADTDDGNGVLFEGPTPDCNASDREALQGLEGLRVLCVGADIRRPPVRSVGEIEDRCAKGAPLQVCFCRDWPEEQGPAAARWQGSVPQRRMSATLAAFRGRAAGVEQPAPDRDPSVKPPDPETARIVLRFGLILWQLGRTDVPLHLPSGTSQQVTAFLQCVRKMMEQGAAEDEAATFKLKGERGRTKVSVTDLKYVAECAQAIRRWQMWGQRYHFLSPESSEDIKEAPIAGSGSVGAERDVPDVGGVEDTGFAEIRISECILDDGHFPVIAELIGYVAQGGTVTLTHDNLLPRHLPMLLANLSRKSELEIDITGNDHLLRQSASTSRSLLTLRKSYPGVKFRWDDYQYRGKQRWAGSVPHRVADGLVDARPSASCFSTDDFARPEIDRGREVGAPAIELVRGMADWKIMNWDREHDGSSSPRHNTTARPFYDPEFVGSGHRPVEELVADIDTAIRLHARHDGPAISHHKNAMVPLFAYTAELHHKHLWAVWECDWQPEDRRDERRTSMWFSTKNAGHWVLVPEDVAMELEELYQDTQVCEGTFLQLSEVDHYNACSELSGSSGLTVVFTQGSGVYGFMATAQDSRQSTTGTHTFLLRYQNERGGRVGESPFRDCVLWAPAPEEKTFKKNWDWLPPPGLLEFIYSRSPSATLEHKDTGWAVHPLPAEKVPEWWAKEVGDAQPDRRSEEVRELPQAQQLRWRDRHFLLALDLNDGFIAELDCAPGGEGELKQLEKNFERLFRVTRPLDVQPSMLINAALRYAQESRADGPRSPSPGRRDRLSMGPESPAARRSRRKSSVARRRSTGFGSMNAAQLAFVKQQSWQASLQLRGDGLELSTDCAKSLFEQVTPMVLRLNEALALLKPSERPPGLLRCVPAVPLGFEGFDRRVYQRGHLVVWAGFASASTRRDVVHPTGASQSINVWIPYKAACAEEVGPQRSSTLYARDIAAYSRQARLKEWLYPAGTVLRVESEGHEPPESLGIASPARCAGGEQPTWLQLNEVGAVEVQVYLAHSMLPRATTMSAAQIVFAVQQAVRGDHVLQLSLETKAAGKAPAPRWEMQLLERFSEVPPEVKENAQWCGVEKQEAAAKLHQLQKSLPATDDCEEEGAQHFYSAVVAKTGWVDNAMGPLHRTKQESGARVLSLICEVLGMAPDADRRPNVCWIYAPTTSQKAGDVEYLQIRLAHWSKWGITLRLRRGRGREGTAIGQEGIQILVGVLERRVNLQQIRLDNHCVSDKDARLLLEAVRENKYVHELSLDDESSPLVRSALELRCLWNRACLGGSAIKAESLLGLEKEGHRWEEAVALALYDVVGLRLPMYDILVTLTKRLGPGVDLEKEAMWKASWQRLKGAFREYGMPPPMCAKSDLHNAARGSELWTFRALLDIAGELKAHDLQEKDDSGFAPLHIAARNPHFSRSRSQALTQRPMRFSSATSSQLDEAEPLRALLGGPTPEQLGAKTADGATPLHLAAAAGQIETVEGLLELGADPTAIDGHDETALHVAAARAEFDTEGCERVLRRLCGFSERIACPGSPESPAGPERIVLNWTDKHSRTPLHIAAAHGRATVCRVLLGLGAKANAIADEDRTPLMYAVRHSNPRAVQVLDPETDPKLLPETMSVLGAPLNLEPKQSGPLAELANVLYLPHPNTWQPLPLGQHGVNTAEDIARQSCNFKCIMRLGQEAELLTWPVDAKDVQDGLPQRLREELRRIYGAGPKGGSRNIVQCYGCMLGPDLVLSPRGRAAGSILIVAFEYVQQNLELVIQQRRARSRRIGRQSSVSWKVLRSLAWQMLCGLAYLQRRGVMHRDVKPLNVLLAPDGAVKLRNVGLSAGFPALGSEAANTQEYSNNQDTFTGSLSYMPPERCQGKRYSFEADTWAVGVVINQLGIGMHPFHRGSHATPIIAKILEGEAPPLMPHSFGDQCRSFVEMCLRKNPQKRPSPLQMLKHRWFAGCEGAIVRVLVQEWLEAHAKREGMDDTAQERQASVVGERDNEDRDTEHQVNAKEQKQRLLQLACVRVLSAAKIREQCQCTAGADWEESMRDWEHEVCYGLRCWDMQLIKVIRMSEPAGHMAHSILPPIGGGVTPMGNAFCNASFGFMSPLSSAEQMSPSREREEATARLNTLWLPISAVEPYAGRDTPDGFPQFPDAPPPPGPSWTFTLHGPPQ